MFRKKLFDIVSYLHFRKTYDLMFEIRKIRFIVISIQRCFEKLNWISLKCFSKSVDRILSLPLGVDKKWRFFFWTRDRCNERFRENSSWYSLDSEERFVKMRWLSVSHVTVAVSADLSPLSSLVSVLCFPLWTRFVVPVV